MAKSEAKTKPTEMSFPAFVAQIGDARRQEEALVLDALMQRVTAEPPQMWGPSIVGYGRYHYRYDSGREGDMCRIGFSPRKAKLVVYLIGNYAEAKPEADALFAALGKHALGQSCLYINKLADVDLAVLERLVALNWDVMNRRYPA